MRNMSTELTKAKELVTKDEMTEIFNKYKLEDTSKALIVSTRHARLVGSAGAMMKLLIHQGVSNDVLKVAAKYFLVCLYSVKYALDWERFYDENGIDELRVKYLGYVPKKERLKALHKKYKKEVAS